LSLAWSRSWPRSWGKPALGDGDGDQVDAEPGPVASSTSDATGGTRASSMLACRSVQQSDHCVREEFLYELKAGQRAASGRPRPARLDRTPRNQQPMCQKTPAYLCRAHGRLAADRLVEVRRHAKLLQRRINALAPILIRPLEALGDDDRE
jgi:hypothetical protein